MTVTSSALDAALDVFTGRTLAGCWQDPARVAATLAHSGTTPGLFTITAAPYAITDGLKVVVASASLPASMNGVPFWFVKAVSGGAPGEVHLFATYEAYVAGTTWATPSTGAWSGTAYDSNLVDQVELAAVLGYEASHSGYARQTGVDFSSALPVSTTATTITREVPYVINNSSASPVNVNHMVMFNGTSLEAVTLLTGSPVIAAGSSMSTFTSLSATRL
jgi:hypothetical protein